MATVGSASVDIVPSVKGFQEKLDAELKNIGDVKIKVEVDVAEATAKIEELVRDRTMHLNVKLYDADALQKIAELERDRSVAIQVNLDDAIAKARLAELTRDRSTTVTVNTVGGTNTAGGDGGGFGGGGLLAAAAPLAALAIPLGAAGLGLGAALGGGALAAVGALGALKLGLSGVGTAVQAVQAQQQSAGTDAATYANAQASAASGVASAQASLANASRAAGIAATTSAAAIAAAQVSLVDAQRSATTGVSSALVQQESAERSLISAQQAETNAQNALTVARRTAQQQIEDLTNSVADGALQQRAAALSVIQAENNLNLARINPNATRFQQEQAQLSYDQAVQQVTDLATRQTRLVEQKKVADRAGVDGAVAVVAAQQAVGNAVVGTAVAQEGLTRSTAAVTEARRAGAESVAKAELAVTAAQQAQANSAASSAASIAGAQASLSDALRQQAVAAANLGAAAVASKSALDALSPAARDFAIFVAGTLEPALKNLKAAAADGLLPGLQAGLVAIMPLMPIFADIIGRASKALGDLFAAAGLALNTPFYQGFFTFIRDSAGPAMKTFGDIIGGFITGALGLFQAFAPVIAQVGGGLAGLATSFANFGTTLATNNQFQTFLAYVIASGPLVATFLGNLFQLIGNLIQGLAPLGTVLLIVVDALSKFLISLGPNGLLIAIAAVAGAVVAFTGGIAAIAIGITAFIALIVNAYQNMKPFHDFIDQKVLPILQALGGYITGTLVPILKEIGSKALDGLRVGFGFVTDAIEQNKTQLTAFVGILKAIAEFLVEQVLPKIGELIKFGFEALGFAIATVIDIISLLVTSFEGLLSGVSFVLRALGNIPKFDWATEAANNVDKLNTSLKNAGKSTGDTAKLTGDAATAQSDAAEQSKRLATAQDGLKKSQDDLNGAIKKSIDQFTILNGGELARQTATDNLAAATDGLSKSVATNGVSLDGNTGKGRANRTAIEGMLTALNDKVTADFKANSSTEGYTKALEIAGKQTDDGKAKLETLAGQLGLNKDQTDKLVTSILKTPPQMATEFKNNLDVATEQISRFQATILALKGTDIQIGVQGYIQNGKGDEIIPGQGRIPKNAEGGQIRGPGTGTSDSILSYVSDGEFIVKEKVASKNLPMLHALNNGQVPAFADGGPVNINGSAGFGSAVAGINAFFKTLTPAISSAPGAGNSVTQWAPVILQALGLQGLPANYLAGVENVIKFESGGNPTAINLTDSNAVAGHPSQGLMQTIPTTFAAYAGPYASRGITDPLANIYAGVAYAMANYGPGFFANGGRNDSGGGYLGYDSGGYIPPGTSQIYNGTGRPEMVFTPEQLSRRDAQGGGSAQFTGTVVNGNQYVVDPDAHAAAERVNMRRASLQYGLGR